jgi:hypothetical protein
MRPTIRATIRAFGCYSAAIPAAIVIAVALSGLSIETVNRMPRSVWGSGTLGLLINIVPALLSGCLVYAVCATWLARRGWFVATVAAHLFRTSLLYAVFVATAVLIAAYRRNTDFWLVGQIPLWSGLAALAGISTDAFLAGRRRQFDPPAA